MLETMKRTPTVGQQPLVTGSLALTELPTAAMVNLRGSQLDDPFMKAAEANLGAPLPTRANRFADVKGMRILWLGPDEWLILGAPDGEENLCSRLESTLGGTHSSVTDVSGNRAVFHLSGASAPDLLAAGCSLDFHPSAYSKGQCAQTLIARTAVILLQCDDRPSYLVLVRRSYADYLWTWLVTAAGLSFPPITEPYVI